MTSGWQPGPPTDPGLGQRPPARRLSGWALLGVCLAWFGLWFLTPGLLSAGAGSLVTDDPALAVLVETALVVTLALALLLTHRRYARVLFARSSALWLYAIPAGLAILLPLHYGQSLPVGVYLVWMTVSVFWQDYLTFGLLQSYLAERCGTWAVLAASATIFWLGHVVFLPDQFGPGRWLPSLAILALGFVLAGLRLWLTTLHLILALHLSFYFIFA